MNILEAIIYIKDRILIKSDVFFYEKNTDLIIMVEFKILDYQTYNRRITQCELEKMPIEYFLDCIVGTVNRYIKEAQNC